jgi:hypothetical protein
MIKHIVIWPMKDEVTAEQQAEMKAKLEVLTSTIPEAKVIEVGIDDENGSMSLYSAFDSAEDLATYQAHPDHQAVLPLVRSLVAGRAVCDYTI